MDNNYILKIGSVIEIDGKKIKVQVDKDKNLSYILYNNTSIKNISINNFIGIKKDFITLIGKIEGESLKESIEKETSPNYINIDKNKRILNVSLIGYININKEFIGGLKEFPLIGNEAYILTEDDINKIHTLSNNTKEKTISFSKTVADDIDINIPINNLFCSHIGIFGNTGSGKSNTLACMYTELFQNYFNKENKEKCKFLFFDFNGEYINKDILSCNKNIYNIDKHKDSNKILISEKDIFDYEIFSIIGEATEKTQQPFLKRTIREFNKNINIGIFKDLLNKLSKEAFNLSDVNKSNEIFTFIENIINKNEEENKFLSNNFIYNATSKSIYLNVNKENVYDINICFKDSNLEKSITEYEFPTSKFDKIIDFFYYMLAKDISINRSRNEHIAPIINRIKAYKQDIEDIFKIRGNKTGDLSNNIFKVNNLAIINLNKANIKMKKIVPMILVKLLYNEFKNKNIYLNIIIDEAHNILSNQSNRESSEWKDYRLEIFEEIIKEGRKFGIFLTISSQRPQDISSTIISQLHNFFIHRLLNENDLKLISSAVSYIDKVSYDSIPTLPIGCCIFSGTATQMPLKIQINELEDGFKPKSETIKITDLITDKK